VLGSAGGSIANALSYPIARKVMRTMYDDSDDILVLELSDKPMVKESS